MEPKTIEQAAPREDDDAAWQRIRMELEKQWHTALTDEASDLVPSKLPISLPPIRHAA